jgi:hypothetical protein
MKTTELKTLIKEAVREAIQEELKDILLEAVRAPKTVVTESVRDTYAQPHIEKPKQLNAAERRAMFGGLLEEMQNGGVANSQYAGNFQPQSVDTINGALPEGSVGLDQIMALMNK